MMLRLLIVALVGCKPFPPPPMIAMHSDTSAAPKGNTTVVLVAGFAGTIFGGGGWGFGLRGEHQVTTRTTLGLEVTGGWGDEAKRKDEDPINRSLYALRGYGRWTPRSHDFVAATYSAGISHLDTGLITGTAHLGTAFSYVNEYAAPVVQFGIAGAWVVSRGEPFGDVSVDTRPLFTFENHKPAPRPAREGAYPKSDLFYFFDAGVVGLIDGGQNRISLDVAFMSAIRAKELVIGFSVADAQRFD